MVPWKRSGKENPAAPAPAAAEASAGGNNSPTAGKARGRATNQILETSPQRRAFSKILRMLNSANEAKGKCEEEKQRLVPKLLRLLKQARKEKAQLVKSHELSIQKAKRELALATKQWEQKVEDLNKLHAGAVQEYQEKLDRKDFECQHLRSQSEKLVDELVAQEKRIRTLHVEKVDENVQLKSLISKHETKILGLLEQQSEERNANLRIEIERNQRLKTSHAEQIKTMEDRNAKAMDLVTQRLSHVTIILQDLQHRKNPEDHQQQILRLHNELTGIVKSIEKNRDISVETPTSLESFADCMMDVEDIQQLQSLSSTPVPLFVDTQDQDHVEKQQKLTIVQLHKELGEEQRATSMLQEKVSHLETKLSATLAESLEKHSEHAMEIQKVTQQLEASKREQHAEKQANGQLQEILDSMRREREESKATIINESYNHDRIVARLNEELASARNEKTRLSEAYETKMIALENNITDLERKVSELNENLMEANGQLEEGRDALAGQKHEYESKVQDLKNEIAALNIDLTQERTMTVELRGEIMDIARKHIGELTRLEREHTKVLDEQSKELVRIQELYIKSEHEHRTLKDEFSTQMMSIEAANEAEISVLKRYIEELESSVEEVNTALRGANGREKELGEEIRRLQSPARRLASSEARSKADEIEEGKENIGGSSDDEVGVPAAKDDNSTLDQGKVETFGRSSALVTTHQLNEEPTRSPTVSSENSSSGAAMMELKRTLFADPVSYHGEENARDLEHQQGDGLMQVDDPADQMEMVPLGHVGGDESIDFDESFDMEDWRERCYFLEHDRDELVRVTDRIIEYEKDTHQAQLEAALATAKREAMDERRILEQQTRRQIRSLYDALCSGCRNKIDSA